ncbi:hypothetical protein B9Z55_028807 [Caenorhabditis nigoni]|uniref:Uncharacterized protein n=1 Tax=Caenorhabditis nigoni TaxID=1611254 RepID=A0A2G5S9W2_9PELO|nr:hypothetical protein B9Z55_028807 [Caenorhabditis nigoni]
MWENEKKDRKVPKPVVRGGGGDIEDSEETEKKIQKVELVRQVDSKTAVCRVEFPSNDHFKCYFKDCKTMSQAGFGADDMKYLTRHFEKAHYTKVIWTYRCGKCQAKADGEGTAATRWVSSHMMSAHREKAVPRIKKSYKSLAEKTMEALNESAPSLPKPNKGVPRKKDVITAPTVVHSTPEKIQELESKIQTRTVTKSLSVLKESAKKKELMEAESPRVVQPDIVLGESVDLKKLTGPERVKMAREQSKRQSRLSIQRRMSFAPSVNSPKIVEEKLQKEESEEIEKKSENEKTQEDVELDLNRTFVIEDDDEIEGKSIIAEEEDILVIDAEKKEDLKAKSSIPKLMEQKLEKPEIVSRREEIKEKRSQKMAKKQKVPSGKPDELVLRVQKWFEKEFESYVEEGKSFQRLEWITEVLTAAIHKASAGDEEAIEKIEKRCPPMEVEEGKCSPKQK